MQRKLPFLEEVERLVLLFRGMKLCELRYRDGEGELLVVTLPPRPPHPRPLDGKDGATGAAGEGGKEHRAAACGGRRRALLLRSPAAGTWIPEEETGPEEKNADGPGRERLLGRVTRLAGDEPLTAPAGGNPLKWLVRGVKAVGYGDPLVLWEVRD